MRREIRILQGFYQLQPAYRLSQDHVKVVTRVITAYGKRCKWKRGNCELDEAYFGGRRKGQRGRATAGKSVVFGLLEREGRVYTKVVESSVRRN